MKVAFILIGLISLSSGSQLTCRFQSSTWSKPSFVARNYHTCFIENQAVATPDSKIETFSKDKAKAVAMWNRQVKYIPTNLAALPQLLVVSFSSCSINSIGNHFKGLQKLLYLNLGDNQIENIQKDAFVDNVKLEYVDLGASKLKHVNNEVFSTLSNLKSLFLHWNQIEIIDSSTFINLVNLEYLSLHYNKLTFIDAKTFQTLIKLKELELYGNKIDSIDPETFDTLINLNKVWLNNNICVNNDYDSSCLSALKSDVKTKCKNLSMPRIEFKINDVGEMVKGHFKDLAKEILNSKNDLKSEILKKNENLKSEVIIEILNSNTKLTTFMENVMDALKSVQTEMESSKKEIETIKKDFAGALKIEQGRSEMYVQKILELSENFTLVNNNLKDEQLKVAELTKESKKWKDRYNACSRVYE